MKPTGRTLTFDGKFFWGDYHGEQTTTHPQPGDIVICLLANFDKMIELLNFWALTRQPAVMAGINTDATWETVTGFTPYDSAMYVIIARI